MVFYGQLAVWTNHIYRDFHIINSTIVISQSPNTSLIIIMNTPSCCTEPAGTLLSPDLCQASWNHLLIFIIRRDMEKIITLSEVKVICIIFVFCWSVCCDEYFPQWMFVVAVGHRKEKYHNNNSDHQLTLAVSQSIVSLDCLSPLFLFINITWGSI